MKRVFSRIILIPTLIIGLGYVSKITLSFLSSERSNNEQLIRDIKKILPEDTISKINKYLLPYREIDVLRRQERKLLVAQEVLKILEPSSIENDIRIKESLVDLEFLKATSGVPILDNNLTLYKYKPNSISLMRGISNIIPGSAYLDQYKNNIFLLSSNGVLGYTKYNDSKLRFKQIKNNLEDYFGRKQIEKSNTFSMKDLLVFDGKIYISFTNEHKEDCWNTSLVYADLDLREVNFKPLFMPDECVSSKNKNFKFTAHQSAGRIVGLNSDEILFSTGEFRSRNLAQDKESAMGKILRINLNSNEFSAVAIGIRNAQGLYYDKNNQIIIFTEHGPKGGDEINLLSYLDIEKEETQNYGWAISSYGEHYGKGDRVTEKRWASKGTNPYDKYPLYKSHKKYGFIEPLKYFIPSIGISEIIPVNTKNKIYAHASLVDESLYFFKLDDQNRLSKSIRIQINERIRDMINYKNKILLFLEDTGSIGLVDLNELDQPIDRLF
ncbi:PQQ-dependent sugar dehydrogenase [Prochlorococcus sp. MIT 1341]|uniref:PQQ-dependent sugar dehydrogenase n=1 Tax=Prochlorococcus sp. MIT 1341 TaxID=3096221 RepID=UPI002A74FDA5|nr:PQQ-dependent sugar dehydrogenase [Prochlorococcus sp. MIT 1341]